MEVAEHQFQQQQGQHRTHRLEDKPFRLQNIPEGRSQPNLLNKRRHHSGAGRQDNRAVDSSDRPIQTRKPVRRQQRRAKGQEQPHHRDPQHRGLDGVPRETQIQPPIEENQTHQQTHNGGETLTEVKRFDQAQPGAADQQAGKQQQNHAGEPRQSRHQPRRRPGKNGDAPEQT